MRCRIESMGEHCREFPETNLFVKTKSKDIVPGLVLFLLDRKVFVFA
jgi:hypothetical protein